MLSWIYNKIKETIKKKKEMENIQSFNEFHKIDEAVTIENDLNKIEKFIDNFSAKLQTLKYAIGGEPAVKKHERTEYVNDINKAELIFIKSLQKIYSNLDKKNKK
jgi:hypothetical protein